MVSSSLGTVIGLDGVTLNLAIASMQCILSLRLTIFR